MKQGFNYWFASILILLPLFLCGKDPCHYSTEGKDFWFGLMQNRNEGAEHYIEITVSSRKGAEITLSYGN
jgi:hypothetical protein